MPEFDDNAPGEYLALPKVSPETIGLRKLEEQEVAANQEAARRRTVGVSYDFPEAADTATTGISVGQEIVKAGVKFSKGVFIGLQDGYLVFRGRPDKELGEYYFYVNFQGRGTRVLRGKEESGRKEFLKGLAQDDGEIIVQSDKEN